MSPKTPEQKAQEELDKQMEKLHEEWLKHPVTQDALKILSARATEFQKQLQDGILIESDETKEHKLRVAMNTLKASHILLSDTKQFVQHLNKQ